MRAILAATIFCLIAFPSFAENPHRTVLVLTYVMPRDEPDLRVTEYMDSTDECWDEAKQFVARGIPKQIKDKAVAVMAACLMPKMDEDDL